MNGQFWNSAPAKKFTNDSTGGKNYQILKKVRQWTMAFILQNNKSVTN